MKSKIFDKISVIAAIAIVIVAGVTAGCQKEMDDELKCTIEINEDISNMRIRLKNGSEGPGGKVFVEKKYLHQTTPQVEFQVQGNKKYVVEFQTLGNWTSVGHLAVGTGREFFHNQGTPAHSYGLTTSPGSTGYFNVNWIAGYAQVTLYEIP